MSTLDQKLAAQAGHAVVFASNAALALSRQVAERQRQLAQELRTPVIVEMPAERPEKEERPGSADGPRHLQPSERADDADKVAEGVKAGRRRFDVRI